MTSRKDEHQNTEKRKRKNIVLPELLAPAGSVEGLKAVTSAGADAVYIGGSRFGARAYADNPEEQDLLEAIDYAHLRGVKVYLTVNTLLKDSELPELAGFIAPYYEHGVDAVLVQDFGVLKVLHEQFPDLPLHASTQMTVTGPSSACLLKEFGVTRVVPARELNFSELEEIRRRSGLEVEIFVHGALCVCYSGQCLYSSMLGGRSGNRGRCAQPCRLLYLKDDRHFDGAHSILEESAARHFLSPKDLCAIDLLPQFVSSGIASLKIEGRMKQPEYAAGVVSVYRAVLDRFAEEPAHFSVLPEERQMLYDLYNRSGFTDGYFTRRNGPQMMAMVKHELTPAETDTRHRLYDRMHDRFIAQERNIPAEGTVSVFEGKPMTCSVNLLSDHSVKATVSGPETSSARTMPLTEERIRESLMKTGGSDFEIRSLKVLTDGMSFVPVKQLNELRRDALRKLRNTVLAQYMRRLSVRSLPAQSSQMGDERDSCVHQDIPAHGQDSASAATETAGSQDIPAHGQNPAGKAYLTVLVSSEEQFEAALRVPGISELCVDAAVLYESGNPVNDARSKLAACKKRGLFMTIATPRAERSFSEITELKDAAEELIREGLSGFLVRSFECLADLILRGLSGSLRADEGIYTWNRESMLFLQHFGIGAFTAPYELNRRELEERAFNERSEFVLYGRIPLMTTVQCLEKNTVGCTRKNASHMLTDRTGVKFPVKCCCVFCYNTIYNSVPLDLCGRMAELREMGFRRFRVELSTENPDETEEVIIHAVRAADQGTDQPVEGSTRGHFRRGVQ